jgi:hypothetical protein
MENLAPSLRILIFVRYSLERGEGLKSALTKWLKTEKTEPFSDDIQKMILLLNLSQSCNEVIQRQKSPYRRACLQVLMQGLKGESIYAQVCALEEETLEACKQEVEAFQLTLPIKTMLPLVLFQFPAFLLIVLGPLLLYINQM